MKPLPGGAGEGRVPWIPFWESVDQLIGLIRGKMARTKVGKRDHHERCAEEFGLDSVATESSKHCYDVSFCFCLFIEVLIIQRGMIDLFNASISQLIIPQSFS